MSDKLLESAITGGLNMWNGPILMAMVPRWQWSHINGNPHMYALQETRVPSLAWEEPLEESPWQSASVFLPGESPQTEEPGGLQSIGSQRVT